MFEKERCVEPFLISQKKLYYNFPHVTPTQFSTS